MRKLIVIPVLFALAVLTGVSVADIAGYKRFGAYSFAGYSAPGFYFEDDPDSGLSRHTAGNIDLVFGGAPVLSASNTTAVIHPVTTVLYGDVETNRGQEFHFGSNNSIYITAAEFLYDTETLTSATDVVVFNCAAAAGVVHAATVEYQVYAKDGSGELQVENGTVNWVGGYKAAGFANASKGNSVQSMTTGTLTVTFDSEVTGGNLRLRCNATTSLTTTAFEIRWFATFFRSDYAGGINDN